MTPKIRNISIFIIIALIFALIFVLYLNSSSDQATLSLDANGLPTETAVSDENSLIAQDFLTLLLNVKNIKLDDSILSDSAFTNLQDSSIVIVQDTVEGRPNPFAQFGNDSVSLSPAPLTYTLIPGEPN